LNVSVKRWLLGTYQGAVRPKHLPYYLDEFTFRFNRRDFITQSDEDAAAHRLREHRDGPAMRQQTNGGASPSETEWSDVDRRVNACIVASKKQGHEPALIAFQAWGWTEENWREHRDGFNEKQQNSWYAAASLIDFGTN